MSYSEGPLVSPDVSFENLVVLQGIPGVLDMMLKAAMLAETNLIHSPVLSSSSVKLWIPQDWYSLRNQHVFHCRPQDLGFGSH